MLTVVLVLGYWPLLHCLDTVDTGHQTLIMAGLHSNRKYFLVKTKTLNNILIYLLLVKLFAYLKVCSGGCDGYSYD